MALNTLVTSGKWATNGNWSKGTKPEASDDVIIPAGKEVKIEAAAKCRSLYVEGNAKVAGNSSLEIGNSEKPEWNGGKPEVGGTERWALKVDSEAVFTAAGAWTLLSTSAETQKVSVGLSVGLTKIELKNKSTAKYKLEAALTITGGEGIKMGEETTLDTNGFAVKVAKFITSAKATLTLGATTLTVTGSIFEVGAESTVSAASSTIILEGASGVFSGGGYTWGTVTLTGLKQTISGSSTFGTLNVNNKGAPAGEGLKLTKSTTQTVTTIACNGTEAELARLESTEAAKAAKLKLPSNKTCGKMAVKDITVEGGKLYDPFGKDETGNTNVLFESEPVEGGETLGMLV